MGVLRDRRTSAQSLDATPDIGELAKTLIQVPDKLAVVQMHLQQTLSRVKIAVLGARLGIHSEWALCATSARRLIFLRSPRQPLMRKSNVPDLYNLLDALVALRIEFEEHGEDGEAMQVLTSAKAQELRSLLDAAIGSTKHFIGQKHDGVDLFPQHESPGQTLDR